ncbi:response regulator [Sphingomonas oryzagri]
MSRQPPSLAGCRILVVDDEPLLAEHVADVLERAGARVVGPYSSIVEALDNLDQLTALDGAVLDIGLGAETSFPLAEALQTTRLPFVFVTGQERHTLPPAFSRAAHLLKPFQEKELIATLIRIGVTTQ